MTSIFRTFVFLSSWFNGQKSKIRSFPSYQSVLVHRNFLRDKKKVHVLSHNIKYCRRQNLVCLFFIIKINCNISANWTKCGSRNWFKFSRISSLVWTSVENVSVSFMCGFARQKWAVCLYSQTFPRCCSSSVLLHWIEKVQVLYPASVHNIGILNKKKESNSRNIC